MIIRRAISDDCERIAEIYAPYVRDTVISFETEAPCADEMRRRMADMLAYLVACEGDAVIGYAYASRHRERQAYRFSVDVSVYVDAAWHRRGVGRRLYDALFAVLRRLGYVNAFAGVTLPNPSSVGLHESLGFRPVGIYRKVGYKHGAWHDTGWWHRVLREVDGAPQEPLAIDTVDVSDLL